MPKTNLSERTMRFYNRIGHPTEFLSEPSFAQLVIHHLVMSAASMTDNYRAAYRVRSRRDCIDRLKKVEEETYEMLYWLKIPAKTRSVKSAEDKVIIKEAKELLEAFVEGIRDGYNVQGTNEQE